MVPISVSRSLIGGLVGAAIAKGGFQSLVVSGITNVVLFIFLSPVIGLFVALFLMVAVSWIFRRWAVQQVD